jgi:hypothetical protein
MAQETFAKTTPRVKSVLGLLKSMAHLSSRRLCPWVSSTLMLCERSPTASMICTSWFITLKCHSIVLTDFTYLPATGSLTCTALRLLSLTCSRLHGTLAARLCRSFAHPVSRLQVLHHRPHGSARTSATRAGKFGHYTLA